jgi:patatin-related protein
MAMAGLALCVLCAFPVPGRTAESPAPAPEAGPFRELRIALVCYGGSSLAIYMHGNTKEFHHLVAASKALEDDARGLWPTIQRRDVVAAAEHGRQLAGTTRQYYNLLLDLWRQDPGQVRTRIVIDVIAGTSAGGINGIILAKALAHDLSQEELTELWLNRASLARLTNGYFGLLRVFRGVAPIDGDALVGWLFEALSKMDARDKPGESLLPPGNRLDLFVTATDHYGYPQHLVVGDPTTAMEDHHRHVLHFTYPGTHRDCAGEGGRPAGDTDHFCAYWTPALTFASRATSSIPGVFPPLSLESARQRIERARAADPHAPVIATPDQVVKNFFRAYQLQQTKPQDNFARDTFFVDGGVINNYPFGPAIDAIMERSANQELRRVLVYLEPDPGKDPLAPPGEAPKLLSAIWAGLHGIPSSQPILDELERVADHNGNLDRIRDIVRAEELETTNRERSDAPSRVGTHSGGATVAERLVRAMGESSQQGLDQALARAEEVPPKQLHEKLQEIRKDIEMAADQEVSGLAGFSYINLRVQSVLEQFITVISDGCRYPPESAHRALVAGIVKRWAASDPVRLTGDQADRQRQEQFLMEFDIGYLRRQLRFVIDWVNEEYKNTPSPGWRSQLDQVKAAASEEIKELTGLITGTADDPQRVAIRQQVGALFGALNPWEAEPGKQPLSIADQARAFVDRKEQADALDTLRHDLARVLLARQEEIRQKSFQNFVRLTQSWDDAPKRRQLLVRYMGFPFWDRQIYPYVAFSNLAEFRDVEVFRMSPDYATLLMGGIAAVKLFGARKAHFGAFLSREGREQDYLWGRLDAGERIVSLLKVERRPEAAKAVFCEVLGEEKHKPKPLVRRAILQRRDKEVATLPGRTCEDLSERRGAE